MITYSMKDSQMRPASVPSPMERAAPWRGHAAKARSLTAALLAAGTCLSLGGRAAADQPPSVASSQKDAAELVRKLMREGNELYKDGRYPEAEEKFRKAWEANHTYDVAANLGHTEMKLNKPREAAEHLSFALRNWPSLANRKSRELAEQRLKEAHAQIGTLTVRADVAGAELTVDGVSTARALLPNTAFVLPGRHIVRATLDGYEPASAVLDVAKGESRAVPLSLYRKKSKALIITGTAVTAALTGTGVALMVVAGSKRTEAKEFLQENGIVRGHCPDRGVVCQDLQKINRQYDSLRDGATAAFISGGVVAAATIVYWAVPWASADKNTEVRAEPIITKSVGGLWVSGAF